MGGLGIRHAKYSIFAFMSKLGWGLIHNHDKLWVKVLRSKYQCGGDLNPLVSLKQGFLIFGKGFVKHALC